MFCQYQILVAFNYEVHIVAFAGVANAIDLADRFLPKLKSLNCELNVAHIYNVI